MQQALMLGGHVQKAKRAKEKRGKERSGSDGGRRFKYSAALDSADCSRLFTAFSMRVSAAGESPAGAGA